MEHESDNYTNCDWCSWYSHQMISTRTGGLGNKRTSGDHPNYWIIEISQNTEESPGYLRRLTVPHTPVRNHQLKLVWKTPKGIIIIIIIIIIIKEKRICKIVNFVPADHRIKLKECEKREKYLDLARELKKLWSMKVTIIPIVIGAFDTVTKGLLKGLEDLEVGDRVETTQATALLKTARILRRVLETWGDLLSLNLQWNTSSLRWCENSNE